MDIFGSAEPIRGEGTAGLYGRNMLEYVAGFRQHLCSAYETARYVLTHGNRCPADLAVTALDFFDRAAFAVLERHQELPVMTVRANDDGDVELSMFVNSLGRLHIRRNGQATPQYHPAVTTVEIGSVRLSATLLQEVSELHATAVALEEREFRCVRRDLDKVHADGQLAEVLEQVIDHVSHVESVCFYIGDKFFALIDRFTNLVASRKSPDGALTNLRAKDYGTWSNAEILMVAALHALFISGRSVRFEEFNGAALTATALRQKLNALYAAYVDAGCAITASPDVRLFELAHCIREQAREAERIDCLRYRRIYGLNFQKNERILKSPASSEPRTVHLEEFAEDYGAIVGGCPPANLPEDEFFLALAKACIERDMNGPGRDFHASPPRGCWLEALIDKIVASAVLATDSDYGMSSSLRDVSILLQPSLEDVVTGVHRLEPADFFCCFVSRGFADAMDEATATVIAASVQKRMMFNRWHFLPGNFERGRIAGSRHWYYPPVIPDIAIHSDVHRAGHSRARVKYSVRAPGPDMSRPPLMIAGRPYRGFYDVRVVRMDGQEYSIEDMLRTRRRTLWMESVYDALVKRLEALGDARRPINGFAPGKHIDLPAQGRRLAALGSPVSA
jgi:hypothetical protein